MITTVPGRCAIYFRQGMLVLDTTYEGDITDENAYENVRYEERDGKLGIEAEQLRPIMYKEFEGAGFPYSTSNIDDLHPSRIKTKWVRKHWWWPFEPKTEQVRYAHSGWQRLKDNTPKCFTSTCFTVITGK